MLDHLYAGEQVHHVAQAALVQLGPGKVLGQDVLEAAVLLLDSPHGVVDDLPDLRRVRSGGDCRPARILRHKEDALGDILVDVLLKSVPFVQQLLIPLLETVGDVFQKNEAKDDVLYSGISMLPRSTQAASQICFSKPMPAVVLAMGEYTSNVNTDALILPQMGGFGNHNILAVWSILSHKPVCFACCYPCP